MLKLKIRLEILFLLEITVYADRSFSFITKTPPAARLILKSANIKKGSSEPNKEKVGVISDSDLEKIADN